MLADAIFLAGRDWLVPVAAAFGIAAFAIALSYARSAAPARVRIACAVLKLLGVAALLACLLEPMWSRERAKPGANVFAIIADNSRSLTLKDAGATASRADALRDTVMAGEWRGLLAENFEVREYLADSRLRPAPSLEGLTFEGRTSALGESLRQLVARHRGQPLAGVILLTDGNASDLAAPSSIEGLPPVFPVIFGSGNAGRDLAIAGTAVTLTSFDDAPVTVQADVAVSGFGGEEIVGRLMPPGGDGKPVAEQTMKVPRDAGKVVFRFQIRPEKSGITFYRLTVGAKSDGAGPEMTMANNEEVLTVDRGRGPYRVLYVSGRPNWEFKFLRRSLEGDDQTQLVGLIRIAKREPKFDFRGRAGESSNPLFRGFGNQSKEEVERYDQPVLVRMGTEDAQELSGGFPKTPEELFRYRAVIVDDLEAEFFSAEQMSLLQRFVSERGGGFLMLGGGESFGDGNFSRTAVGDMLPVYLDTRTRSAPGELQFALTREGWLQPWARLRTREQDESKRLAEMPKPGLLNRTGAPKPAAMVVATVSDGEVEHPAIVAQQFGRGRTAALTVGDFWQTGFGDEQRQKDLGRAWRQMVRWLVADVPALIEARTELQADAQTMRIEIRARDAKFAPMENARVNVELWREGAADDKSRLTLPAEASPSEPGVYVANFIPRESGGWRVAAKLTNEAGADAGTVQTGWSSNLEAREFRELLPNRALMEQLALRTGGEVVPPDGLGAFIRGLRERRAPVNEMVTEPLWHNAWVFLFALACFLGEWGIRRRSGLA